MNLTHTLVDYYNAGNFHSNIQIHKSSGPATTCMVQLTIHCLAALRIQRILQQSTKNTKNIATVALTYVLTTYE